MVQFKDKTGIEFNSVNVNGLIGIGNPIGNNDIVGATSEDLSDIAAENGGKLPTTVNSVEIDWNGANLGNYVNIDANGGKSNGNSAEINTTGALLSYISALAQRIDELAIAI